MYAYWYWTTIYIIYFFTVPEVKELPLSGTYRTRKLEVLQILLSIMKLTTSMFSKSKSKMTLILWWMWSILEARPAYSRLWHQRQKGRLCSLLQVRFGAVSEAPTAGSPVEVRPCVTMTIATSLWPTVLIGTRSTPFTCSRIRRRLRSPGTSRPLDIYLNN